MIFDITLCPAGHYEECVNKSSNVYKHSLLIFHVLLTISTTKTNRLMEFRIIMVYCGCRMEHVNKLSAQTVELYRDKSGGVWSNH